MKLTATAWEMLLQQADIAKNADARSADVLIVNTCGFLEAAKEESIGVLQELADGKRRASDAHCGRLSGAT